MNPQRHLIPTLVSKKILASSQFGGLETSAIPITVASVSHLHLDLTKRDREIISTRLTRLNAGLGNVGVS